MRMANAMCSFMCVTDAIWRKVLWTWKIPPKITWDDSKSAGFGSYKTFERKVAQAGILSYSFTVCMYPPVWYLLSETTRHHKLMCAIVTICNYHVQSTISSCASLWQYVITMCKAVQELWCWLLSSLYDCTQHSVITLENPFVHYTYLPRIWYVFILSNLVLQQSIEN